jgi:hypothetical protein
MDQRVGLVILGLLGAIAIDGLYAATLGRPWSLHQDIEVVPVSVQAESAEEQQLLESLQNNDGHDIHVIWTNPGTPKQGAIGWTIEAGGFITPASPMGCPTQERGIADQLVVQ